MLPCQSPLYAQVRADSAEVRQTTTKKTLLAGLQLISTNPNDTIVNERSIDDYAQYAGKIIRRINVDRFGFEKSIYDTTVKVNKIVTDFANTLHHDSREGIIRKHLFIAKNQPLNPHRVADNERYLRDKDFILDSRIFVTPVEGTDSVDLTVVTRDVFSLGGSLGGTFPSAPKIGVYDANVDGRAQRVEFDALIDQDRRPRFGYSLRYRKSSIFGSLANVELGYSQINTGISIGAEPEFAVLARIDRPLVSPYSRLAGGFELSRNWSKNVYDKPDTSFQKYKYKVFDIWMGYNIGTRKEIDNRNRHFAALRYFNGYYIDQPEHGDAKDVMRYSDAYGYLAEVTFYRQDFFKTRYVFGFGRTEDVPYGVSLSLTGGSLNLLSFMRTYSAVKFSYSNASRGGNFYGLEFQTGGYVYDRTLEDMIIQGNVSYFTRVLNVNRFKVRNSLSAAYTQLINQNAVRWLTVNDKEIPGFATDSLRADSRLALQLESVLFTPWSLLGFRFAPFTGLNIVSVNCHTCEDRNRVFWGISSGVRTRNENLIFGTIEFKVTYIPEDEFGNSQIVFGFRQNLRVRNSGTFVRAPSLISYN